MVGRPVSPRIAIRLAAAFLFSLATLATACTKDHDAVEDGSGSISGQTAELRRSGFLDAGALIVQAHGAAVPADVRAGLTAVAVGPDVEFEVEESWTLLPGMDSVYAFRFSRTFDGRVYYFALYATDPAGAPQTSRWRQDAPRPGISDTVNSTGEESVLLISVYSGAPFVLGLPPVHAADGGWHRAVLDERGHVWIDPHPELSVALDTGERIDRSPMREVDAWPARLPFPDLVTLCGTEPYCFLLSKGGMFLPSSMAEEITCTRRADGLAATLSLTRDDVTLEFDVHLGDDGFGHIRLTCGDVLGSRSVARELPVAFAVRAREASSGRFLDLVSSADGRIYVGDSTPHLRCPPCVG